jgi:TonB family protein
MRAISAFLVTLALFSFASAQAAGEARAATPTAIEQKLFSPPVPTKIVSPEQPKRRKKHGEVHLQATIKADGTVTNIRAVSGKRELVEPTRNAVQQWRYRPAEINGHPVQVEHDFLINFTKENAVALGPDDLSPNLTTQPPPEVTAMVKESQLGSIGNKVSAPKPISAPDPEYSERARQAKYSGICEVTTVVGTDGLTHHPWVSRPVGEQLDEKALDILKLWRFTPAMRDGKPVPVLITVQFKFDIW